MKDIYLEHMLARQPADLNKAMVLFDYKNMGPDTSSPHIVSEAWLADNLIWNQHRADLYKQLKVWLEEIEVTGVMPKLMMLGGSFVSHKDSPKDIDGLLLYVASESADVLAFKALVAERRAGIDIRVAPYDSSPALLIKTIGVLSYSLSRKSTT